MTTATWVDATTNTDGSTITSGEITGYILGIRPATVGVAGSYPTQVPVTGPAVTSETLPVLPAGAYAAAIMSVGPVNSAWSAETTFTVLPTPNPPTGLKVV